MGWTFISVFAVISISFEVLIHESIPKHSLLSAVGMHFHFPLRLLTWAVLEFGEHQEVNSRI
jgi:hypothetical protein